MEKGKYWQKGYEQGLEDGKTVSTNKELDRIVKDIYDKHPQENAQAYIEGWQEGFGESVMTSISELRKKIETDIA